MTVSSTTTRNSYSGNGSTTTFAYGFKIFADADLTVILRASTGVETVQSLTTNYTVTNAGNASGGNVVFGTAPASGVTVVIRRNMAITQATDYVANDPFPAATHEDALDRLTFISQQMQEEVDRGIKLSRTNTMTSTEFTTSAADRASKVLAFDSNGELSVTQELGTFKGNSATTTTAAFKQRDIVKATTTAQLNNIYICVADSVIGDTLTDTDHFALLVDAVSAATSATTATTKASEASTSASTATTKASEAATSASNAATTLTTFQGQYHGASGSDPTSNLDAGDLYFKTDGSGMKVYTGSAWVDVKPTSSEQTNINTVASANSNISALAASAVITDMGILATSDNVANMATLATGDIITDLNTLATSDIVTDMNLLATSANVTAMGLLGTSANVTAMGLLGTSAVVTDMGLLGTAAVVEDMGLLATTAVIEDMGLLATSANVTNMATLGASGVVTNIATVASNVSGVNSFADRYRIASSAPSDSLDVGDLYFDTTANELKVYKSSGWAAAGSTVNGTSARFHYDIGSAVTSVTGSDANGNTLAYDAGFIDVYVNGVRMSTADVTITSGDTVTFASALASGDEVDIVAFGTFAVANIVSTGALNSGSITSGFGNIDTGSSTITTTGAITGGTLTGTLQTASQTNITSVGTLTSFRSTGIDDNASSNAITLDSSGNLLVNKTSDDNTTVGGIIRNTGVGSFVADGNHPLIINRKTSDGDIISIRKDGSTVGSIGVAASDNLYIAGATGSTKGLYFNDAGILPATTGGGTSDNAVDLGQSNVRYKDLHLSNRVKLSAGGGIEFGNSAGGRSVSSTLLDDYEEGTWTPSVTVGTSSAAYGFYTKIGRQVFLSGRVSNFSNTTNNEVLFIQGLPFVDGSSNTVLFGTSMIEKVDKDFGYEVVLINTDDRLRFFHSTNADSDPLRHVDLDGSDSIIYFQGTYFV
mgnify:CR=1 FL=1